MKAFKLKTSRAQVIIMGNYLAILGVNFITTDLRSGERFNNSVLNFAGDIESEDGRTEDAEMRMELDEVVSEHLKDTTYKGTSHEVYRDASKNTDWRIRALVALNVKFPETLSTDEEDEVVASLVSGLINDRRYGVTHDDISWLDALTTHPSVKVRCLVAEYGKKEHLDVLVDDIDHEVLVQVVLNGYAEHLDKLVLHPNYKVRKTVIELGTEAHCLQVLNDDSGVISADHIVSQLINTIIRTGHATAEVLSDAERRYEHGFMLARYGNKEVVGSSDLFLHKAADVRVELAKRGLFLDTLVSDQRYEVRKEVAKWGVRQHLLILINDTDARVRLEVAKLKFTRAQATRA